MRLETGVAHSVVSVRRYKYMLATNLVGNHFSGCCALPRKARVCVLRHWPNTSLVNATSNRGFLNSELFLRSSNLMISKVSYRCLHLRRSERLA
jgi:hypothetical protein